MPAAKRPTDSRELRRGVGAAHADRPERDGLARPHRRRSRTGSAMPFAAAVERIAGAKGRVIVTGMGKSGHVGAQDRRHLRLDRHARPLRPSRRGEPWRSRHGAAGRRDPRPLLVGRDDGTRRPRRLCEALPRAARRHHRQRAASTLGRQADVCLVLPKGAGGLPERPCARPPRPPCSSPSATRLRSLSSSGAASRRSISASSIRAASSAPSSSSCATSCIRATGCRSCASARGWTRLSPRSSAKGFGCVIVVDADGRLAGIVTDGDLRRTSAADLRHAARRGGHDPARRARSPPTRSWRTPSRSRKAAKITALIVVEGAARSASSTTSTSCGPGSREARWALPPLARLDHERRALDAHDPDVSLRPARQGPSRARSCRRPGRGPRRRSSAHRA